MHTNSLLFFCLIIILLVIHKSAYGAPKPKARGGSRRVPRSSSTLNFPVENKFNSYGGDDGSSNEDSTNSNGMQFMITSKMKNILINKLGYLSTEVDEMEPQIAAVVIDRSLPRPSKGMPASWKRPKSRSPSAIMTSLTTKLQESYSSITRTTSFIFKNYIRPAIPIIVVASVVWFQGENIKGVTLDSWKSLKKSAEDWNYRRQETREIAKDTSSQGWFGSLKSNPIIFLKNVNNDAHHAQPKKELVSLPVPQPLPIAVKINFSALDKALKQPWWKALFMKSKVWLYQKANYQL